RHRDHLLEVALLARFWLNPMVYPFGLIRAELGTQTWIYLLNPMSVVVTTFQRAIYNDFEGPNPENGTKNEILADPGYWFYLEHLAIAGAISLVLLWFGFRVFRKMRADFAEDL
nr:hypothetical protein [Micromonospora sp. DSM 115978]